MVWKMLSRDILLKCEWTPPYLAKCWFKAPLGDCVRPTSTCSVHLAGADLCNSTLVHLWREDWGKAITETISSNHTSPKQWCSPCPWNAWSSSSRGNYCSISYFQKCFTLAGGEFPQFIAQLHHFDNWATEGSSHLAEGRSALSEGGCSIPFAMQET